MFQFLNLADIIPKVTQAYIDGYKLAYFYNSIYWKTFYNALNESDNKIASKIEYTSIHSPFYDKWLRLIDKELDIILRSENFTSLLSEYVNSLVDLRSVYRRSGYPVDYLDWLFDWYVRHMMFLSSIHKEFDLTPFEVVYTRGKVRLLHYYDPRYQSDNSNTKNKEVANTKSATTKVPLLIVYAPINRFHIMDLSPEKSVVRELLSRGLDVYLLDWGYPGREDDRLSINDYVNYVHEALQIIKRTKTRIIKGGKQQEAEEEQKISLLGYCWGGIFALIYTALNNYEVKDLVLMATPVDFSKDNTILANWAKAIDSDKIVEEFGHMDGQILDLAFILRNPPRYTFDKYVKLFKNLSDKKFVDTFIDVERWLYDTPPIPGILFRQIIDDCYRNNMLISNTMMIDGKQIDLQKIDVPLLTVVAEKDDLSSPESSLAVNEYVSSKDKKNLKITGGHVGLCIGHLAHQKLWPEVAEWIIARS